MNSSNATVRLPGLLWFLSAVAGGFSLSYMRSNVIVPGDAAATAGNILASEFLFRAAIVGSLFSQMFLFFLGLALFHLFKDVHKRLATVLLASVLLTVGLAIANTLNQLGALFLLSGADFLKVFSPEQLNTLALFLLRLANGPGQGLLEIFWAPYYFSFGLLVIRSKFLPKIFGILLMLMAVGFAINILEKFLLPQFYPAVFTRSAMLFGALGGIPTILWLWFIGAKIRPLEDSSS